MRGEWAPSGFIEIACRLGWGRATGSLSLRESRARHTIYVRGGDVVGFELADEPPRIGDLLRTAFVGGDARLEDILRRVRPGLPLGRLLVEERWVTDGDVERALSLQSKLRLDYLATRPGGSYHLEIGAEPPSARTRTRPVSLLAWARARLERRFDARTEDLGRDEKAVVRLTDATVRDPAMLSRDERRLVRLLEKPRTVGELLAGRTERQVVVFLWLLEQAGVLAVQLASTPAPPPVTDARSSAERLLGVMPGASRIAVKRAFKKLVHERHPDRHAQASDAAARELTGEMARLIAAYRLLVD